MRSILPLAVSISALSIALSGCNAKDASDLSHDLGQTAKTATRAAGNAQLVIRINAALAQRKGVDVSGLHFDNDKGTVTAGGHVRTAKEKNTVLNAVKEIRGVDKVIDKLRIEPKG